MVSAQCSVSMPVRPYSPGWTSTVWPGLGTVAQVVPPSSDTRTYP